MSASEPFNPSPEWTDDERKAAIQLIALKLKNESWDKLPDRKIVFHLGDAIDFLLNNDASMLEENRSMLLDLIT